ncbi:MAG TPA: flagellar hook-basal body complex protein [Negativicutes bacterium]|nr:flagellar hook-basal body complex protein [Negativicutes bacterium]
MMRSLFSGVAGLRNHQSAMDVIGANISNVNTPGYKGSRSTFSDVISQTMQGAAGATGNRGGTNPMQIGLGVGMASVDTLMTSGSYQPTGKQTDLAIQNEGFFIVSDGANEYYTRAGAFDFDNVGNYEIPGTGMKVMGWVGVNGVVDTNGPITSIEIPMGITIPAEQTTSMTFAGNLSGTDTPGSTGVTAMDIYDSLGAVQSLGEKFIKVDDVNNVWLAKASLADASIPVSNALTQISFDTTGRTPTVRQVQPGGLPQTAVAFANGMALDSNAAGSTHTVGFSLYDASGNAHNYDMAITSPNGVAFSYNIYAAGTTTPSLGSGTITPSAGAPAGNTFVPGIPVATHFDPWGTGANIIPTNAVGAAPAAAFVGSIPLVAPGTSVLTVPHVQLDNTAASVHNAYYTVFDAKATPHVLQMKFTNTSTTPTPTWSYQLTEAGITSPTTLISGTVTWASPNYTFSPALNASTFNVGTGASLQSMTLGNTAAGDLAPSGNVFNAASNPTYTTTGTVSPVTFTAPGAAQSSVTLDVSALTQYGGTNTAQAATQNGYAAGSLDSKSVDTSGMVVGKFSNGKNLNLARVALATFTNPGGLLRTGDTLFAVSNNSGTPQVGISGTGGRGTISPGTLEMANIDLADQFSKMIITQRGFQANSKIITVTDTMLEELANLKR